MLQSMQVVPSHPSESALVTIQTCESGFDGPRGAAHTGSCGREGELILQLASAPLRRRCVFLARPPGDETKEGDSNRGLCFCPEEEQQAASADGQLVHGMTSQVLVDRSRQYVLKILLPDAPYRLQGGRTGLEACFLNHLRGVSWVPRLICTAEHAIVMSIKGQPANPLNLPSDWRPQFSQILTSLWSLGIRHGDLMKPSPERKAWAFGTANTEIVVDSQGQLGIVDFGCATFDSGGTWAMQAKANGSLHCARTPHGLAHLLCPSRPDQLAHLVLARMEELGRATSIRETGFCERHASAHEVRLRFRC
jgi:hypothetical protein